MSGKRAAPVGSTRARRQARFDRVELHGAHSCVLCQFFGAEFNHRDDEYGGTLENRSRILFEIIDGVRSRCGVSTRRTKVYPFQS